MCLLGGADVSLHFQPSGLLEAPACLVAAGPLTSVSPFSTFQNAESFPFLSLQPSRLILNKNLLLTPFFRIIGRILEGYPPAVRGAPLLGVHSHSQLGHAPAWCTVVSSALSIQLQVSAILALDFGPKPSANLACELLPRPVP